MQDVGIDHVVLALHSQSSPFLDHRSSRAVARYVSGPISTPPTGARLLETSACIDRVAHRGVGDVAVASDLANHHPAAVDANAHARPIGMLLGQAGNTALQCESGARRPLRVVGLVSSVVEHGHDAVADELLDFSAELTCDAVARRCPSRHRARLQPRLAMSARRSLVKPDEIGKEDAHVLVALPRRRQVEPPEPLIAPLATSSQYRRPGRP